jgi:NAD(P)-dependent dehydrogenase (short-subunit alcohol dehydrogenase family)
MKTVLVTGANKGIGFEICRQLGALGYHVILSARNKERGIKAANALSEMRYKIDFLQMDVSNEKSIMDVINEFKRHEVKLDVLINNAGILLDDTDILDLKTEVLEKTIYTNTFGAFWVIKTFLPLLNNGGRIINISSGLGSLNEMSDYAPAYSISKTAMNAITKQFSIALKDKNIAVNSVSPGWVRTDMGGENASRPVEKGAETAVWLAVDAPINLTGKFLRDRKEIEW